MKILILMMELSDLDFPYIKDKLQCKIYNSDRECIDIDTLKEGNSIILLLF